MNQFKLQSGASSQVIKPYLYNSWCWYFSYFSYDFPSSSSLFLSVVGYSHRPKADESHIPPHDYPSYSVYIQIPIYNLHCKCTLVIQNIMWPCPSFTSESFVPNASGPVLSSAEHHKVRDHEEGQVSSWQVEDEDRQEGSGKTYPQ